MGQASKGLPLQNKKWPLLSETTTGQRNVAHPALGAKSKIYLSPLHIMLGLIKVSVKATDKESEMFAYFRQKFPKIIETKKKKRDIGWSTYYTIIRRPSL